MKQLLFMVFAAGLACSGSALASESVASCLAAQDVGCAKRVLEGVDIDASTDPAWLYAAARVHFFAGEYPQAYEIMVRAVQAGHQDRYEELALYGRVVESSQMFTEVRRGDVIVRYRPGVDAVLIDDTFAAIGKATRFIAPVLGGPPPGPVAVELFPNTKSFAISSSLTEKDVATTGVVALSKWTRLLVVSPRTLGRGYDWQGTIAHEYIHLVVSHHTHERTPVWLQEGIANFLDNRWRDGRDRFALDPRARAHLGRALRADKLVPFAEMHPSLAKLDSANKAALAYAQLSSLIHYCFRDQGEDVLLRLLPLIDGGQDAFAALATVMGKASFDELEREWKTWAQHQSFEDRELGELPTVLGGEGGAASDPVMSRRRDLANFMRLGELLAQREHYRAALVEYGRASDANEASSPLLSVRIAQAYLGLDKPKAARAVLNESLADYPEFTLLHKTLGAAHMAEGRSAQAAKAYTRASEFDPFDLQTHQALITLFQRLDNPQAVARHTRLLRILRRGGEG